MYTKKIRIIYTLALLLIAINANGQRRYCDTYEDFLEGRWMELDTIHVTCHRKNLEVWEGGNIYTMTTGNKDTDKILKKKAFAVMLADTLYVNCRNLRYEKQGFGNGYAKGRRIGERSILIVNKIIGQDANVNQFMSGFMFGLIGSAITASQQMKQQVCYIISSGADNQGEIPIRLISDDLMDLMIVRHDDLRKEFFEEKKASKRILAKRVIPLLEKAGLFEQYKKTE
ncbi:MAG: hypothetical protein IJV17_02305 [Prevotella sp.]|nr:hypothetical protein [Prevotella sp.]MBQ9216260.1 hypothetical protein [Prevotella sp.]